MGVKRPCTIPMLHPMPKTSVRHKIHYSNSSPRKSHHDNQQVVVEVEDKNFYQLIEEHKKQLKLQEHIDKNAMKLCESARTQFQLMIERQEEKHERLMASMSSKLKQVLSTHISLTEHQHLLQQQAKSMQQEYDDLKSTHQEEIALLQQKHKEQTQQTTQDMIVELQKEIQPLLNQITQLKTKLNEFQAVQKNDQKEIARLKSKILEGNHAKKLADARFNEACQHIISLKSELQKSVDFSLKISNEKKKKIDYRDKCHAMKLNYTQVNAEQLSKINALEKALKLEQEKNEKLQTQFPRLEQKNNEYTDKMYRLVNKITELETREKLRLQHLQVEKKFQEKEIQTLTSNLMDHQQKIAHLKTIKSKCKIEIKNLQVHVQSLEGRLEMERQSHQETILQWQQKHIEMEEKYTLCLKKYKKLHQENIEIKEERRMENLLFQK